MNRWVLCVLVAVAGLACFPLTGRAVILAGGDGTQNTNAPTGGQGWDYVGRINKSGVYSSVTYISNNWFITAYHVKQLDNPTGVILDGSTYSIDPNSWTRLKNSSGGNADLIMFRVVGGTVGLPGLTVRSLPTPDGVSLTMIGNGRNRATSTTTWDVNWNEGGHPTVYTGYKWISGATKRWGTNLKTADAVPEQVDDNHGITEMYYTTFDNHTGSNEAQGAEYDSGGGVFYNNLGNWELAGIMLALAGYNGQPANTSVYGNETYIADMQYYASQINSTTQINDIDGDGIPDEWEYEQTGSTTGVVATADQDGDGFTGEQEWIADTDPVDGNSYPRVSVYVDTNTIEIAFASSTNRQYQVNFRTNLSNTNETWQIEPGMSWFAPTGTQTVETVTAPTSNRFYRVEVRVP